MSAIYRIYRRINGNNVDNNLYSIMSQNIKFDFYTDENSLNLITVDQNLPEIIKLKFQTGNKTRIYVFKEDKNKYPKKKPYIIVQNLYYRFDECVILCPNCFGVYKKDINSLIISRHYLGSVVIEDIYEKL